jgi:hypothetical protein
MAPPAAPPTPTVVPSTQRRAVITALVANLLVACDAVASIAIGLEPRLADSEARTSPPA